jgi:hypothetical protein
MSNKYYVGDVGTEILVDCGMNIEDATHTKICMRKPDGTIIERDADIHAQNGLTEHLRYVTVSEDLNQAGWYKVQAKLTLSGWSGRGETDCFMVYDVFN